MAFDVGGVDDGKAISVVGELFRVSEGVVRSSPLPWLVVEVVGAVVLVVVIVLEESLKLELVSLLRAKFIHKLLLLLWGCVFEGLF